MSDILAELFRGFHPDAKRQIEAAEKFASEVANKNQLLEESGGSVPLRPVAGALAVFDEYAHALWSQTNFASPKSIQAFEENLNRVAEALISRYETWQCKEAIEGELFLAKSRAWMTHVSLNQRKGLDIIKAAMARRGLNPPSVAHAMLPHLRKMKSKRKADRSAVYRICTGETKNPHADVLNALIQALTLKPDEAAIVHRDLGRNKKSPAV